MKIINIITANEWQNNFYDPHANTRILCTDHSFVQSKNCRVKKKIIMTGKILLCTAIGYDSGMNDQIIIIQKGLGEVNNWTIITLWNVYRNTIFLDNQERKRLFNIKWWMIKKKKINNYYNTNLCRIIGLCEHNIFNKYIIFFLLLYT